jgi:hypothetical protein
MNVEDEARKMYEMALLFEGDTVEESLDVITSYIGRMLYVAGHDTKTATEICANVALGSMTMFTTLSLRK